MNTCEYCGAQHDDVAANFLFQLPDLILDLPRWKRFGVRLNPELCKYRDCTFIRATLKVPLVGHPNSFGWGLWVQVDANHLTELVARVRSGERPSFLQGKIANALPPYPSSKGESVTVRFSSANERPLVVFSPTDKSALAEDARAGYTLERQREIVGIVDGARIGF